MESRQTSTVVGRGTARWPREVLVTMLAFLSTHHHLFNPPKNRRSGLQILANYLKIEHPFSSPFTYDQIRIKIRDLWMLYRPEDSKSIDNLYKYGVHHATLPHLEVDSEVTFSEIQQRMQLLSRPEDQIIKQTDLPYEQRKSTSNLQIKCICVFKTEDGGETKQCYQCKTSQHMWCYYLAKSEGHLCYDCQDGQAKESESDADGPLLVTCAKFEDMSLEEDCNAESSGSTDITRKLKELENENLQLRSVLESKSKAILGLRYTLERLKTLCAFTTFGTKDVATFDTGPSDDDTKDAVSSINYSLRQAILTLPYSVNNIRLEALLTKRGELDDLPDLLRSSIGIRNENSARETKKQVQNLRFAQNDLMRSIVWVAIRDWIFYGDPFVTSISQSPFFQSYLECIHEQDGISAFLGLHKAAWALLANDRLPIFEVVVTELATDFSERCWTALESLLVRLHQGNDDRVRKLVDAWKDKKKFLTSIFEEAIRLKARLPLRKEIFEFYLPEPGCELQKPIMVVDVLQNSSNESGSQKVLLSTSPGVFTTERVLSDDQTATKILESLNECVVLDEKERLQAHLICEATVVIV